MKCSIKDFFNKCDQSRSFLGIWSHLLKSLLNFCAVKLSLSAAASTLTNMIKKAVPELRSLYEDIWFNRVDSILAMNKLLNKHGRRHNNLQVCKIRKIMIVGRSRFKGTLMQISKSPCMLVFI